MSRALLEKDLVPGIVLIGHDIQPHRGPRHAAVKGSLRLLKPARIGVHINEEHSRGEYVRDDAYTNTVEGFFSLLKRGINGLLLVGLELAHRGIW